MRHKKSKVWKNFPSQVVKTLVTFIVGIFVSIGSNGQTSIPSQLTFDLNAPDYRSWNVSVKTGEGTSLTGHLDVPSSYTGKDYNNILRTLPVTVIWNLSSNISSVHIPNSITRIEDNGFATSTKLKSIVIPNSVNYVGVYAFKGCTALKSVVLSPNNVCTMSFSGCDIKKGAYPDGNRAFVADIEVAYPRYCIPDSAGLVFDSTMSEFYFAPWNIKYLELPETVSYIGPKALAGCTNIWYLSVGATTPPTVESDTFNGAIMSVLEVPYGCKEAYEKAPGWSAFASKIKEVNTEILMNQTSMSLKVAETSQLSVEIKNESYFGASVKWSSSNENVATVDEKGNVKAISVGTTVITAACGQINTVCIVRVVPTEATGISINKTSAKIGVSEKLQLKAVVSPETTTDKTVIWSSDDDSIASVDANGLVTANSLGKTTIKASCGNVIATCDIEVAPTLPRDINLSKVYLKLKINETYQLEATVIPDNTTDKTLSWTTTDANIATVDERGMVSAVGIGTAKIRVYCGNVSRTCTVEVVPVPVTAITLNETEISIKGAGQFQLEAIVVPDNATDKTVKWSSSNDAVATVDENGLVSSVYDGTAVITATCGNVSATCKVTVLGVWISSLKIEPRYLTMRVSESRQLNAIIAPENANDKTIFWNSWDQKIVKVDQNGNVTAVGVGEVTVSITPEKTPPYNSGLTIAYCDITVLPEEVVAKEIILDTNESTLLMGQTLQLTATVLPEDATDKTEVWSSSDDDIATVDEEGLVHAISIGEAVITATCGDVNTTCVVTVTNDSGIEGIVADGEYPIDVYNLQGIGIRISNANDLKKLSPGLYIFNGKKYIVK